ncbi:MAG: hypothetical protein GY719_02595 [bacterium]|nr:hypothetical protein [bacterium]
MSNSTRQRLAPESLLYWIDFQGVAGLIDAVAGAAPERLGKLLAALLSSQERLEARVVVELTLRCQDPLAPLATLCRDALQAAAMEMTSRRQEIERIRSMRDAALPNPWGLLGGFVERVRRHWCHPPRSLGPARLT